MTTNIEKITVLVYNVCIIYFMVNCKKGKLLFGGELEVALYKASPWGEAVERSETDEGGNIFIYLSLFAIEK